MDKQIRDNGQRPGPGKTAINIYRLSRSALSGCLPFLDAPPPEASLTSAKAGNSAMFTGRTNTPSTEMAPAGALWLEDSVPRCTLGNVVFPELRRGFTPGLGGARDPPGGEGRGGGNSEDSEGQFPGS